MTKEGKPGALTPCWWNWEWAQTLGEAYWHWLHSAPYSRAPALQQAALPPRMESGPQIHPWCAEK